MLNLHCYARPRRDIPITTSKENPMGEIISDQQLRSAVKGKVNESKMNSVLCCLSVSRALDECPGNRDWM
jgi:hypothetical protein